MLRRFRVAPRLTAAFLTVLAAVVAAAGVGMWKMGAIKSEVVFVADNTMPAITQLEAVMDGLSEARMNQMFLSSEADPASQAEHKGLLAEQRTRIEKALKAYEPTIVPGKDQEFFDRSTADVKAYFDRADAIAARTTPGAEGIESMHASQELFVTAKEHLGEYIKFNNSLGDKTIAASNTAYSSGRTMLIAFVVCALAAGLALAIMIAKSVTRPLDDLRTKLGHVGEGDLTVRVAAEGKDELTEVSTAFNAFAERMQGTVREAAAASRRQIDLAEDMARGAEQSGMAIAQIATTVDEIARGSQDQAEATARVNDTMEEMSEGVRRVAHSGESAAGMAQDADQAATEGSETVRQATEAIAGIERRVAEASEIVVALGERGAQVGQIVDTISDIAGQTNLLALNAAIEAARAGEQGRGFAVVAEEVRQLAEGTQQQVGSISSIVREIQDHTQRAVLAMEAGRAEVEQGVQRVAAAGGAFDTIRDSVGTLSSEVMSVAAAAQQLEAGSTEVREALHGVAAVSEENAASVEQVSASTEETSASAQETAASAQQVAGSARTLADMMETFKV